MTPQRRQTLLSNCSPRGLGQHTWPEWAKLTPSELLDVLDDCPHATRHAGRELLSRMETQASPSNPWQVASSHSAPTRPDTPSKPGDDQSPSARWPFSLKAGGITYQVLLLQKPDVHIAKISR